MCEMKRRKRRYFIDEKKKEERRNVYWTWNQIELWKCIKRRNFYYLQCNKHHSIIAWQCIVYGPYYYIPFCTSFFFHYSASWLATQLLSYLNYHSPNFLCRFFIFSHSFPFFSILYLLWSCFLFIAPVFTFQFTHLHTQQNWLICDVHLICPFFLFLFYYFCSSVFFCFRISLIIIVRYLLPSTSCLLKIEK